MTGQLVEMDRLRRALQALVLSKLPFVLYRMPEGTPQLRVLTQGQPLSYTALSDLDAASGFVMAPFDLNGSHPVVLWPHAACLKASGWSDITTCLTELLAQPDWAELWTKVTNAPVTNAPVTNAPLLEPGTITTTGAGPYRSDFAQFSAALHAGVFQKLVLSSYFEQESSCFYVLDNFMRACAVKPELMVALVQAPQVGTWFVATPEVLVRTLPQSSRLHTMALAGTMPYCAENMELAAWSHKNREEQALVTSYLTAILGEGYEAQGPYPVKAGSVVHLRTDLTFTPKQGLSALLAALHPTPAVCGLPKAAALDFIVEHESYQRSYYAGFLGEMQCPESGTNLFVNLRTIELLAPQGVWGPWTFRSYVGGGLLAASNEDSEYAEICAKNRSVLSNLKPELWRD